ncbi:MAG: dienelactone hydrolase family protein [Cyclobacteriaceae bacterium]|nr:dienelactone hydrolase family protein [Cyclobacteriaceae bacterium HetDA_MAG_MS6]
MKSQYSLVISFIILVTFSCSPPTQKKTAEAESKPTVSGEFQYSTDTVNMKGYFASQAEEGQQLPGILVIHEWWGHNDYARKRADMLSELGYVAMAIDMYGDGKTADHPDDAGKFAGMVFQNIELSKAKFEAALEKLKEHPNVDPEKIGAVGYCFGGTVALNMANAGYDLDAVAAFHSGLNFPIKPETAPKASILVCNGADDQFVPAESVGAFKALMDDVGADYHYIAYPGAVHSFTSKEADVNGEKFGLPLAYNAVADSASWSELQSFLTTSFQ